MAAPASSGQTGERKSSMYSDILAPDDDELDPRVKTELESLNQSAADVNCLEKEIDAAREKYQMTFSESFQQLEQLKKKASSSIKKARPYFELKEAAKKAQQEALQSARKFQAANGVYLAAKETISLAELRLMDDRAVSLSAAWQEMLNHALVRVTDAEREKTKTEKEHLKKAAMFSDMELRLHGLEKKQKKSIAKARCYFETKKELEIKLQQLKQTLEDLQQAMRSAKRRYSVSLHHLEAISNGIHERRRQKLLLLYPREPGVGAEQDQVISTDLEGRLLSHSSSVMSEDSQTPSELCDSESFYTQESDGEEDEHWPFEDIQNESVFRARVLNTSLDEEDTSFMDISRLRGRRKSKLRAQSLPLSIGHGNTRSPETCSGSKTMGKSYMNVSNVTFGEFGQGVNPDRLSNTPPDGDSLSHEDNLSCGTADDDVKANVLCTTPGEKGGNVDSEAKSGLPEEETKTEIGLICAQSANTEDGIKQSQGTCDDMRDDVFTSEHQAEENHVSLRNDYNKLSGQDSGKINLPVQTSEDSADHSVHHPQTSDAAWDSGEGFCEDGVAGDRGADKACESVPSNDVPVLTEGDVTQGGIESTGPN